MSHETVPENRRLYMLLAPGDDGRIGFRLSVQPPPVKSAYAVLIVRGMIMDGTALDLPLVSQPLNDPDVLALQSASLLGVITIAQTATVALAAGLRTIGVVVPLKMGLKAGEPVLAVPTIRVLGYAVHDAVAVLPTLVSVTMTAPALAIGQKYELPCKLIRLNI